MATWSGPRSSAASRTTPTTPSAPSCWPTTIATAGAVPRRTSNCRPAAGRRRAAGHWRPCIRSLAWARPFINDSHMGPAPKRVDQVLKRGDVVRVALDADGHWQLAQLPKAQAALVTLRPDDGAVEALVGGFSYTQSKFNRATQIARQPGSSFKPFLYSAAFQRGFTPASIINDA